MTSHPENIGSVDSTGARACRTGRGCALWPSTTLYVIGTAVAIVLVWPLGLAMLAWALFHREIRASSAWQTMKDKFASRPAAPDLSSFMRSRPSNEALAEYLAREQQRLREEQQKLDELVRAFEAFKAAERRSSDQRDFEEFMRQREAGAGPESKPDRRPDVGL